MEYIKSKITAYSIFIGIVMLLPLLFCLRVVILSLIHFSASITDNLLSLFFFFLFLFVFNFLKSIRYIIIKEDSLSYYSLLCPFGRTLYFSDYIGKIVVQERGSGGGYNVVYLIDKKNRTAFKITGIHYKKFGQILRAIPLKSIDFKPTTREYFKLLFFERITIKESSVNKNTNKKLNKILIAIQIISIIGLLLFIIGSIIKMLLKLG